jgi:endonuclease/exonuclease/phosphatase family metal-dependent hydrolase
VSYRQMFRWTALTLLLLAAALPAKAQVRAEDTPRLRIASYNIENAFDVFDDPYTRDEGTDVKLRWEVQAIADALRKIDADVVGFQEVENEAVLQAMVDEFLPDMGYRYVTVPLTNDQRGIKLGLISRLPIISVTSYRWQTLRHPDTDRTWRFARDLLHARLQAPGGASGGTSGGVSGGASGGQVINVFVVHLKSKGSREGDPQSVMWRSSEAVRIRQIIGNLIANNPDELVVLMGDFNSKPGEPAVSAILSPTPDGRPLLSDAHAGIPMQDRTTYPSERFPNSVIDFIFTSPAMTARLVPGSAAVFNDPQLTKGSDHYPIVAEFDLSQ